MGKTRLETNFVRLLDQCKSMANSGKHIEWRFEKYVITLEEYLSELRRIPLMPDKETLDEYARAVAFLKGLNITEKLPSATDKVVASQFLTPCSSPYTDIVSKEIHHKLATQYTNQVREELMTVKPAQSISKEDEESNKEFENPASILRQRKAQLLLNSANVTTPPKDFETMMKDEQKVQEEITNDLLLLTQNLKEQSNAANMVVRKDIEALGKSNILAQENNDNLHIQTQKLQERSGFCGRFWVWLLVLLICFTFVGMVVFMRLFKKKSTT